MTDGHHKHSNACAEAGFGSHLQAVPLTMSSLEIAGFALKRHDNVLRDIRKMLEALKIPALTFEGSFLGDDGKAHPLFNLPKRETLILVSGYSTEMRARIIDRWLQLEAALNVGTAAAPEVTEMLARTQCKVTDLEKAVRDLESAKAAPTFDFAGTVTSDQIIEMAGIKRHERVKGTATMVTSRMIAMCALHERVRTPVDLNPSRPWRFNREKAAKWLFGETLGAELVRNQIARMRRRGAKNVGQAALHLVAPPPAVG